MMQRRRTRAGEGDGGGGGEEGDVELDEDGVRIVVDDQCNVSSSCLREWRHLLTCWRTRSCDRGLG